MMGDNIASRVTAGIATWKFLGLFNLFILAWAAGNMLLAHPIDPPPFIGLNLLLSWIAGVQAPMIMIAQKQQERVQRDTMRSILAISSAMQILLSDMDVNQDRLYDLLTHQEKEKRMEPR